MSELSAAMEAAVASVGADRRRRASTATTARPASSPRWTDHDGVVHRRDEDALPPIVSRREPQTFTAALRDQYGPVAVAVWTTLREAVLMVVLFWVCAILLAFVEVEGSVHVPGVGDAAVVSVAVFAATVLRAVLAAAGRAGEALESR